LSNLFLKQLVVSAAMTDSGRLVFRKCKNGGFFKTPGLRVWPPPNPGSRVPGFNYVSPAAGPCWR